MAKKPFVLFGKESKKEEKTEKGFSAGKYAKVEKKEGGKKKPPCK